MANAVDLDEFACLFRQLTGNCPLSWQTRLFATHFAENKLDSCSLVDLPTGLGKTMVIAIWLIARSRYCRDLPRRLIYVVDRRTVVDQATDLAMMLQCNANVLGGDAANLAISTLRGQLADNREWTKDPSRLAIIIGTVDLIGSGLLFSGYRSGFKRRPLEAGFLGQDSLLVLDETHLSRPFEKLACAIGSDGKFQKNRDGKSHGTPIRVIRMSATGDIVGSTPFRLQFDDHGNLTDKDAKDSIISQRFQASKCLQVRTTAPKADFNRALADAAIELAVSPDAVGKRIAVFVRSPDVARDIADKIRNRDKPSKSKSNPDPKGRFASSVEVLTGTMRGLERDELVENAVFKQRWLKGDLEPNDPLNEDPVFLISTSAGEVGFDLNADHLVGDAAPLDSWIQRLGRVNRRGKGNAIVFLLTEPDIAAKTEFDEACMHTSKLFADRLDALTERLDVSPKALAGLMKSLPPDRINAASSPRPNMVELTDILLDNWSMTSISERMPGRPEVGPWLRGIEKEQAETTVAWRAELELFTKHPNPEKALKAVFAKHRPRPHECVTTYSYRVAEFLKDVVKPRGGRPDLIDTPLAVRFPRGEVEIHTLGQLIAEPDILYAEPTLILPAFFGGLDGTGMLTPQAIPPAPGPNDPPLRSLDVADHPGYEQRQDAQPRLRLIIRRTDEGNWVPESLNGGVTISDRLALKESYSSSTALFADLRKADLRIRLVEPVEFNDEGDVMKSLVMLAPVANKAKPQDQSLTDHVGAVEKEAQSIAGPDRLALTGPFLDALLFAARWHDEGKKAEIWQRYVYGEPGEFKGKSSCTRDPKSLRGYRHEFGSLMRIHRSDQLPADSETLDLALHLIATHHGFGRPHFDNPVDRDFKTKECDAVHVEAIRRFAHLQRKYGWWQLAWLENLLRCADAQASADDVSEDDVDELNDKNGEAS